jgi:hypothetical protein
MSQAPVNFVTVPARISRFLNPVVAAEIEEHNEHPVDQRRG